MSPTTPLRPARTHRPSIETLESRIAPAAFVVNTLSDVVAADGFVSLREAIQAANTNLAVNEAPAGSADGDSITFDPSLFGHIELSSPLTISDDLTIDGSLPAHDVIGIDGLDATRLFIINTTAGAGTNTDVSMSHLDLVHGNGAADNAPGGAIYLGGGKLTLNDLELDDNSSPVAGGAIYATHATLIVTDSFFDHNTAADNLSTQGRGGAIGGFHATLTIKDSEFDNNQAVTSGGAIDLQTTSDLTLSRVEFDGNSAGFGGTIANNHSTLLFMTGTVTNSHSDTFGGAIANTDSQTELRYVHVTDNSAGTTGGAIFSSGSGAVLITGGLFSGNTATAEGGAIYSSIMLVISGAELSGNSAVSGGALYLLNAGNTILTNSSLYSNSASTDTPNISQGGGAIWSQSMLTIIQSTFSDNGSDGAGGNLHIVGGTVSLSNSTVVGGTGTGGPNIAVDAGATLTLTSSIVAGGGADLTGAGGATINVDHSLVQDVAPGVVNGTDTASIYGQDPFLGSFGDHGGFLPTYDLQSGSPAIDTGSDPNSLPTDQRGAPFARTQGHGIDMGAVESLPDPVVTLLSGGKKAQFTDVDGDLVTISTNKGAFTQSDIFLVAQGIGAQLVGLDISYLSAFAGANISIKAKPTNRGGDGFVNVSFFDATGVDLGNVLIDGDITSFHAGDDDASTAGVNGLSIASAGEYQGFGEIHVNGSLNSLKVRTDMTDTDITISGGPLANLGKTKVTGSVYGADIEIDGGVSTFTVAGNLIGTDFIAEGSIGTISASTTPGKFRYSGGLVVKGSILGGDIGTNGDLANLRVSGDLQATRVTVRGDLNPADVLAAQTIGQLTVGGRVYQSDVLVGYDLDVLAVNPDVLVEKVAVTGNWVASNLSVGADAGADGFFGTVDDMPIGLGNAAIVSRIASLTIKGAAYGTPGESGDYFGIAAEEIVKGKIALAPLALSAGASNDFGPALFGTSFDFAIHEVGATV